MNQCEPRPKISWRPHSLSRLLGAEGAVDLPAGASTGETWPVAVQPGPAFSTSSGSHLWTKTPTCQQLRSRSTEDNYHLWSKCRFATQHDKTISCLAQFHQFNPDLHSSPCHPLPSGCQTQCSTQHILTQLISFALVHDLLGGSLDGVDGFLKGLIVTQKGTEWFKSH